MSISQTILLADTGRYHRHLRWDILRHVPPCVSRALSVGCGAGVTEAELVRRGVEVVGIEQDQAAAAAARANGLAMIEGDAQHTGLELPGPAFDCLIYGDVLEHCADPLSVLKGHVRQLRPGGTVIISVPNFRRYSVLWQLVVRGRIQYTDAGILDRTHLRITTRRMAVSWMEEVGLESVSWTYELARRRDKVLSVLGVGLLDEMLAQQIIVVGTKPKCQGESERH